MSYIERLKKLEIPIPPTDKTDKSPENSPFDSSVSFVSYRGSEKFPQRDPPSADPFVSFGSAPPRDSKFFSSAVCAGCRHSDPATATDPHSWHTCGNPSSGQLGWWGMAPNPCEGWEEKP